MLLSEKLQNSLVNIADFPGKKKRKTQNKQTIIGWIKIKITFDENFL